jgi:raffinose/stachyose/melibiose transport system permease protein
MDASEILVGRAGPARPARAAQVLRAMARSWALYLLLLPAFAFLVIFTYAPAIQALYQSFFDWYPGQYSTFVGLRNYERIMTDPTWWLAWRNMLLIILYDFTFPFVAPFIMAECIFNLRNQRLKSFFRIAVLVPSLIPGIVTLMLWKWMYQFDGGLNILLKAIGLESLVQPWLGQPHTALPALLFMGFPFATGTHVLIYLAGLNTISRDVLDAATMDGCSRLRRVFAIDLPNTTGVIRLFVIFGVIGIFQEFGRMLVVTGGGPFFATTTPALMLYQRAFGAVGSGPTAQFGEASAIAVILFVLILFFSWLSHRYIKSSIETEGIKV